ncbi:PhzF family phenazine biosynthesis protein [bacterium]|nr:PhzF family phenazine biosynthesis protein [bacterium]
MSQEFFVVDAFTSRAFAGNPAAVLVLPQPKPVEWMQALAAEFNLSETAFVVPHNGDVGDGVWQLRWFTPTVEVDLCGHATLASAHVLFEQGLADDSIAFETRSGRLHVRQAGDGYSMRFPATAMTAADDELEALGDMLGAMPAALHVGPNYFAVFSTQADVAALQPDFARLAGLPERRGVICTAPGAPGSGVDFVSRYFVPSCGIDEDPVTGSAHCALAPYWAARLDKHELRARQISRRGGDLLLRVDGDAVAIGGQAVTTMRGVLADAALADS